MCFYDVSHLLYDLWNIFTSLNSVITYVIMYYYIHFITSLNSVVCHCCCCLLVHSLRISIFTYNTGIYVIVCMYIDLQSQSSTLHSSNWSYLGEWPCLLNYSKSTMHYYQCGTLQQLPLVC